MVITQSSDRKYDTEDDEDWFVNLLNISIHHNNATAEV